MSLYQRLRSRAVKYAIHLYANSLFCNLSSNDPLKYIITLFKGYKHKVLSSWIAFGKNQNREGGWEGGGGGKISDAQTYSAHDVYV